MMEFVSKVLGSEGFLEDICRSVVPQLQSNFLPSCVADYMARTMPKSQLEWAVEYMKAHIDFIIFRTFRLVEWNDGRDGGGMVKEEEEDRGSQQFYVHVSSTPRDARMFALQAALHKRYPLLASEGYASLSRTPVRNTVEGKRACAGCQPKYVGVLFD